MIITNQETQKNNAFKSIDHPVKATALQYIREMTEAEHYEDLAEIVAIAREFGAGEWEIRIALMRNNDPYRNELFQDHRSGR